MKASWKGPSNTVTTTDGGNEQVQRKHKVHTYLMRNLKSSKNDEIYYNSFIYIDGGIGDVTTEYNTIPKTTATVANMR